MPTKYDTSQQDDSSSQAPRQYTSTAGRTKRSTTRANIRTYLYALAACFGEIAIGYDVGAFSFAILFFESDPSVGLTTAQITILVGMLNIVGALGSVISGPIVDAFGRKSALIGGNLTAAVGAALLSLSVDFPSFFLARFVMGLGSGIAFMAPELYCAEISPPSVRGFTATFGELMINFGILLGYLAGLVFPSSWRGVIAGGAALPVVAVALQARIPESPRWLVQAGRRESAASTLAATGDFSAEEVDAQLAEVEREVEEERRHARSAASELSRPRPSLLRAMAAGWGAAFLQQATGSEGLLYFIPSLLRLGGRTDTADAYAVAAAAGAVKVVFILVPFLLMDRVGRRPLLLLSSAGLSCMLLLLAAAFAAPELPFLLAVGGLFGFFVFFSLGWGPLAGILLSEVFPLRVRGVAVGIGWALNRVASGVASGTFLPLATALGASGAFTLYFAIAVSAVVYVWFLVPETKGITLEDITHLFERRAEGTPTRNPRGSGGRAEDRGGREPDRPKREIDAAV